MNRRVRMFATAALVVVGALAGTARPAGAHANLVGTEPSDGAVAATAPAALTLRFDEDVRADVASVALVGPGGPVALAPLAAGTSRRDLVASPVGALVDGVYRLTYKVRDPVDLHLVAGSIVFGVGRVTVTAAGGDASGAPRAIDVALRWLERLGLAAVVGGAALLLLIVPRAGAGVAAAQRALAMVRAGAVAQLMALAGLLAREVVDIGSPYGRTLRRVLASGSYGRRVLAGAVVAGALVALPGLLRPLVDDALLARWRRGRLGELGGAVAVLAVAACLLLSLAGHSSTGGSFALGAGIRLVHLVAAGVWAGGLAGLVLVWRGAPRTGALVSTYSRLALPAMAVVVVTGLLLGGREVASITALLSTWFGAALLVKLGLLAAVACWGLRHAVAVGRGRPVGRAGLRIEAMLAVAIVGGGSALSATSPAVGPRFSASTRSTPPPPAITIGDVTLKLTLRPNRPGPNLLTVVATSSRKPAPGPIVGITVDFRPLGADGAEPLRVQGGAPSKGLIDLGTVQIPASGPYQVEVQLERPAAPLRPAPLAWTVDPFAVARARTVVSDARLAPWAEGTAAVAALVGVGLVVRRRRRGGPELPDDRDGAGADAGRSAAQPLENQAGRAAS